MRLTKGDAERILHEFAQDMGTKCDMDAQSHRKAMGRAVAALTSKEPPAPSKVIYDGEVKPRRRLYDKEPDGYLESDRDYVENNMGLCVQLLNALEIASLLNTVMRRRGK
jgi:hypothetical protein